MDEELDDLSVTVVLSYREAKNLIDIVAGNDDLETSDVVRYTATIRAAMQEAVKERRDLERRAPRF